MKSQSGNVLFLILIAVALFAALSYAVTSSSRSGGGSANKEKAQADAAVIIQYGTSLRSAVRRMKIMNNCSDTQLDFSNAVFKENSGNPVIAGNTNAPSDKRCHVFNAAGGNMIPIIASATAIDPNNLDVGQSSYPKAGHANMTVAQIKNIGTDAASGTVSANDLVFYYSYLNKATCMAVNDLLGIPNPNGEAPIDNSTGTWEYYADGSLVSTAIYDSPHINGQPSFCAFTTGSGYFYYMTLLER